MPEYVFDFRYSIIKAMVSAKIYSILEKSCQGFKDYGVEKKKFEPDRFGEMVFV